jgi:hypothetical protein
MSVISLCHDQEEVLLKEVKIYYDSYSIVTQSISQSFHDFAVLLI